MKTDYKTEIDCLNKAIDCLENEVKAKDELIRHQNNTIEMLKEHNARLKEMLENIFDSL